MSGGTSIWAVPGTLHRAIVSLPAHMNGPGRYLQERVVFFHAPVGTHAATHLVSVLQAVWNVDAATWLDCGLIYNVDSPRDLQRAIDCNPPPNALLCALRLLETGYGGAEAAGPGGEHYARAADVDLFVKPSIATVLSGALAHVEGLYAAKAAARAAA